MNRPAATVAMWWANPLDIDAVHPCIPLPRDWESRAFTDLLHTRPAGVIPSERQHESASAASQ